MTILPFPRRFAALRKSRSAHPRETRLAALTRRIEAVQEARDYCTTPWSRNFLLLIEWELKQRMNEEAYAQIREAKDRAA